MGVIVDQSVKGTIYTYVGVALGFIGTILQTHILAADQIGLTKILVAYSTLFAQFGTLGVNGVIIRYFPFFRNTDNKHHGFLSVTLLWGIIGFVISTLLLLLFKPLLISSNIDKAALFVQYINWLIVIVFFQIFFTILDGYYTALFNSVTGTFLSQVLPKILIITTLGAYFIDIINFHQFVLFYIAALSLPTLFILIILIVEGHFSLKTEFEFLKKNLVKRMLLMAAFSILGSLSILLVQSVDTLMVNGMVGLSAAGVYTICFYFGAFVSMPSRSIYKIANIVAANAWKNNDLKVIRDVYYKSCITLFIIGILLFIGIWGNIHNIFRIIGLDYISGKWVIFWIGLGNLIDLSTGANSSIMGSSKYYRIQTVFLIGLVVLIVIANYLLIPVFGIDGAAIGSAISLTILNIARFLFLYYKFNLQPFNIKFIYVTLIAVIAYLISTLIPKFPNLYLDIILRSAVITILFGLPVYFLNISEDINRKADQYLRIAGIKK